MRAHLFYSVFAVAIALGAPLSAARADAPRDMGRHAVVPFVTRPFPAMRPHPDDLTLKRSRVKIALRNARPTRPEPPFCCIFGGFPFDASVISLGDELTPAPETTGIQQPIAVQQPIAPVVARARPEPKDETIGAVTILRGSGGP